MARTTLLIALTLLVALPASGQRWVNVSYPWAFVEHHPAAEMIDDGALEAARRDRYAGWSTGIGTEIMDGSVSLPILEERVAAGEIDPAPVSGRQEQLENLVNRAIRRTV